MRTIIAGSRGPILSKPQPDFMAAVNAAMESCRWSDQITEVVSGKARGVDRAGEKWAEIHKIPVKSFPADWRRWPKSAGAIRNREMAKYAQALICIWDGYSTGSAHMVDVARANGLRVHVHLAPELKA